MIRIPLLILMALAPVCGLQMPPGPDQTVRRSIYGITLAPDGKPVAHALVEVMEYPPTHAGISPQAYSDASGNFEIAGLLPGGYLLWSGKPAEYLPDFIADQFTGAKPPMQLVALNDADLRNVHVILGPLSAGLKLTIHAAGSGERLEALTTLWQLSAPSANLSTLKAATLVPTVPFLGRVTLRGYQQCDLGQPSNPLLIPAATTETIDVTLRPSAAPNQREPCARVVSTSTGRFDGH